MSVQSVNDEFPMSVQGVSDECPMSVWWVSDECLMSVRWISDECLMSLWWVSNEYPMSVRWMSDESPIGIMLLSAFYFFFSMFSSSQIFKVMNIHSQMSIQWVSNECPIEYPISVLWVADTFWNMDVWTLYFLEKIWDTLQENVGKLSSAPLKYRLKHP